MIGRVWNGMTIPKIQQKDGKSNLRHIGSDTQKSYFI